MMFKQAVILLIFVVIDLFIEAMIILNVFIISIIQLYFIDLMLLFYRILLSIMAYLISRVYTEIEYMA